MRKLSQQATAGHLIMPCILKALRLVRSKTHVVDSQEQLPDTTSLTQEPLPARASQDPPEATCIAKQFCLADILEQTRRPTEKVLRQSFDSSYECGRSVAMEIARAITF